MKKILFLSLVVFCSSTVLRAQEMTAEEYIAKYKDLAISEMKRMGIPAAITLAQGLLESENGNSELATKANNHFGIKCKSTWTAATFHHDDDAPGECFRVYKSAEDSYRDHSNFLRGSDRYAFLFRLDPLDYKGWAYGLSKAGYATNPKYPEILIKYIEDNNLQQYTIAGLNEIPYSDNPSYAVNSELNTNDTLQPEDIVNGTSINPVTINGSKALFATKGTSLLAIATQNNINLNRLLEMNDLQHDGLLDKDQYIFLEKKQKQGDKDFYIVQGDESLYDVAQKNGVLLQNLYDYNSDITSADHLYPGTKIYLRPQITQAVSDNDVTNGNTGHEKRPVVIHTVRERENLYTISRHYSVTIDQLKQWNKLDSNNLKTGQRLIVSK